MNDLNKIFDEAFKAQGKGNHKLAIELYEELVHDPRVKSFAGLAQINYNCGLSYMDMDFHEKALEKFNLALMYFTMEVNKNGINDCGWHICLCHLHIGNWVEGMRLYCFRYLRKDATSTHRPNLPIDFDSVVIPDAVKDKNILVFGEQGFGDMIMFSTVFKKFESLVGSATFIIVKELVPLFEKLYGSDKMTFIHKETVDIDFVKKFDQYMMAGDVYSSLCENIEEPKPFNKESKEVKKVGICWQSNPNSPIGMEKSYSLEEIVKFVDYSYGKECEIVSLQKGAEIPENFKERVKLVSLENFLDTFNAMDDLDAVVSVDTAVIHLAGLKEIKAALLLKNRHDWRWKYYTDRLSSYYDNGSNIYPNVVVIGKFTMEDIIS